MLFPNVPSSSAAAEKKVAKIRNQLREIAARKKIQLNFFMINAIEIVSLKKPKPAYPLIPLF